MFAVFFKEAEALEHSSFNISAELISAIRYFDIDDSAVFDIDAFDNNHKHRILSQALISAYYKRLNSKPLRHTIELLKTLNYPESITMGQLQQVTDFKHSIYIKYMMLKLNVASYNKQLKALHFNRESALYNALISSKY